MYTARALTSFFRQNTGVLCAALLACLLSLYQLTTKSLWYDEACSISFAQKDASLVIVHSYMLRPLYFLILKGWTFLFGFGEFCTRLLSVIFSTLSIFPLYGIGQRLLSKRTTLAICLLYALSPYRIILSQQVQYYSLFVLAGILSMYYFVETAKAHGEPPYGRYTLSSLALLYTHPYGVFLIAAQNVYMFACYGKAVLKQHRWIGAQMILFLAGIPLILLLDLPSVKSQYDSIPIFTQTLAPFLHTLEAFSYGGPFIGQGGSSYRISASLLFAERIIMILVYGATVWGLARRDPPDPGFQKHTMLVALWALLPVVAAFLISFVRPALYQTRYVAYCLPAFCILFVLGASRIPFRWIRFSILPLVSLGMLGLLFTYYHGEAPSAFTSWREAANLVKSHIKENDAMLFVPSEQTAPFWYYFSSSEKRPLEPIGSGRRGQIYWDGTVWQRAFFDKSHLILGVPFHDVYYQTQPNWINTLQNIHSRHLSGSKQDIWIILSPDWMGRDKAKEMIRFFERDFSLVFHQFLDFDGIEIVYFKRKSPILETDQGQTPSPDVISY